MLALLLFITNHKQLPTLLGRLTKTTEMSHHSPDLPWAFGET